MGYLRMVDISGKDDTFRQAVAQAEIILNPKTLTMIKKSKIPKGDVLSAAKIAGIMAAKKTAELIPLCHPLQITDIDINFEFTTKKKILIKAKISCLGKTGVEMEALTAVSISALTIYDMCKSVDKDMVISGIKLLKKSGGRSGFYVRKRKK